MKILQIIKQLFCKHDFIIEYKYDTFICSNNYKHEIKYKIKKCKKCNLVIDI